MPVAALMAMILAVEDDAFLLLSLGWVLEDLGHAMLGASDLAGALAHLAGPQPIDMLFADIRLGALELGGYDVADLAISLRPELPVLYTSGSTLTEAVTARFVPGGRFLQKPYAPDQIAACVEALLP